MPSQMPANMNEVERQAEDAPRDMKCHVDKAEGHAYDFWIWDELEWRDHG